MDFRVYEMETYPTDRVEYGKCQLTDIFMQFDTGRNGTISASVFMKVGYS